MNNIVHPFTPGDERAKTNGDAHGDLELAQSNVARWIGKAAPLVRFVVVDLIPDREVTVIGADGGAGKSNLMQTCATCVAMGQPFLGYAVEQGSAVYITGEDRDSVLHFRQERINRELDVDMEALDGRLFVKSAADREIFLFSDGTPTGLADSMESELRQIPNLRLVVIDSATLVFDDEENVRRPVGTFLRDLSRRADRLGVAIVLITHTSKTSDGSAARAFSGSTGWVWQARAALLLKAATDEEGPSLTIVKANLGPSGKTIELLWTPNHVLVAAVTPDGAVARIEKRTLEREILDRVAKAWAKDNPLSSSPTIGPERYLPAVMARAGFKAGAVKDAMVKLVDDGVLTTDNRTTRSPRGLRIDRAPDWYEAPK